MTAKDLPIVVKSLMSPSVAFAAIISLIVTLFFILDENRREISAAVVAAEFSSDMLIALSALSEGHAGVIRVLAWKQASVDQLTIDRAKDETRLVLVKLCDRMESIDIDRHVVDLSRFKEIVIDSVGYCKSAYEVIDMVDGDAFFATMMLTDLDERFIKIHRSIKTIANDAAENRIEMLSVLSQSQERNFTISAIVAAFSVVISIIVTFIVSRMISRPVLNVAEVMNELAANQLDVEIPGLGRKDEIGRMAAALQVFKASMVENRRLLEERAAEQVERRMLAERLLRERSLFFAAASHDLRQPVHAVGLLASAIKDTVESDCDDRLADLIDLSNELGAVSRTLSEFNEMVLDIYRIETGIVTPSLCEVSLGNLFFELKSQFECIADASDVRIVVVKNSYVVLTDRFLCKRILVNLIGNAIKFSRGGAVLVGCRRRGEFAELMVCDNGIGIAPDDLETIFEDFSQLNNDARQRHNGLGLGLGIAQRVARLLGCSIVVRSALGRGSTFSIRVPLFSKGTPLRSETH